jgi:prepilin-type N-terminal cleavage/methylation domain-containing protein
MIRTATARRHDDGLTLIEVVIAMVLLAILAVSMLPLFGNALNLSSSNISLSTATQLVSKELDGVRSVPETCDAVRSQAADAGGLHWTDPRGTVLQVHRQAQASCPGVYPGLVLYTVTVTKRGQADVLAEASTKIFVSSQCGVDVTGTPVAPCPAVP